MIEFEGKYIFIHSILNYYLYCLQVLPKKDYVKSIGEVISALENLKVLLRD